MIRVYRHFVPLSLLIALLGACAGSSTLSREALDAGRGDTGAELGLLLPTPPALDAFPFPRNVSDALIFAQFYESLTELDPEGRAGPALAASWRSEEGGRVWTFNLRRGTRFWDGRSIEAADVGAAWLWNQRRATGRGLALPLRFGQGAAEISFPAADRLRIALIHPEPRLPEILARPCFAVSAGGRYLDWRLGSGPCRPASTLWRPGEALDCKPHSAHERPARWASLRFEALGVGTLPVLGPDDMDAVWLLDPGLETHLAHRPGLRSLEAPAEMHYLLVLPAGEDLGAAHWLPVLRRDLQAGLLAGTALEPIPGEPVSLHASPSRKAGNPLPILAYDAADRAAAELARRIAALASLPSVGEGDGRPAGDLRIRGLSRADLDAQLVAAAAGEAMRPLLFALPRDGARPAGSELSLIPLARLRPGLVLRASLVGLELGGDGIPRLDQLGPRRGQAKP